MPKGIYQRTEEHNHCGFQKGHKVNQGKPSPIKGRKLSKTHKSKVSASLFGHIVSDETREKIRQGHLGMKASKETRNRISEGHKGQIAWNKGIPMAKKVRRKMQRTKLGDKLFKERERLGLLDSRKVWDEIYPLSFVEMRKVVYKRDNW